MTSVIAIPFGQASPDPPLFGQSRTTNWPTLQAYQDYDKPRVDVNRAAVREANRVATDARFKAVRRRWVSFVRASLLVAWRKDIQLTRLAVRGVRSRIRRLLLVFYVPTVRSLDAIVGFLTWRPGGVRSHATPLLIAPIGGGNVGDEAMLDALLERIPGQVNVVVTSPSAFRLLSAPPSRVTVHTLPNALRLTLRGRVSAIRKLTELLRRSSMVLLPGADSMHGPDLRMSLGRHEVLALARRHDVAATMQGFSWAPNVAATYSRSLRRLVRLGVQLRPRDPVSQERLTARRVETTLAADVVFAAQSLSSLPQDLREWLQRRAGKRQTVAVVNASGLVHKRADVFSDLVDVAANLHDRGYAICFLPHVIRPTDDDLAICKRLFAAAGHQDDMLFEDLLSPAQVRQLVSQVAVVITGRMHLAVNSLNSGTPAITMATEGKVEGLYELFELPTFVVSPQPGCAALIQSAVDQVHANGDAVRATIRARLPRVRLLSMRNFPAASDHDADSR